MQQKTTDAIVRGVREKQKNGPKDSGLESQIDEAILDSLPTGPGRRNRQVFDFARALKAIPALSDAGAKDLKSYARRWHKLAKPMITTQPFEETWIDFLRVWPRVKWPKGSEPMAQIFVVAADSEVPEVTEEYEQGQLRLLVALYRELQCAAGDGSFYLSTRTVGRLLGVDHTTAWRWLFLLEQDGILNVFSRRSQKTMKATRFRYMEEL